MTPESKKFSRQVAIISGGLGDIGRATARTLAKNGADIAIGDLREHPEAEASSLLKELESHGVRARFDRVDISDPKATAAWVDGVGASLGTPSLVIANAAVVSVASFTEVTPEQWNRELGTNLGGCFFLSQAAVKRMLAEKKPGRVVLIGSWAGGTPHAHIPSYCISKAGLRMLCKCMALELAPHDILVNEVAPGYVEVGLSKQVYERSPESKDRDRLQIPLKRLISPDEVAAQVLHLCDPENRHSTGSTVLIDGGLSLLSGR